MSWTDEELGDLLTETFRSREPLADPDRARALGPARPRRRWMPAVAAAAVVVLVAGGASYVVRGGGTSGPRPADAVTSAADPTSSAPAAQTYADNRAVALAEARRAVGLTPLPDVAVRLDGEPADWPGGDYGLAPSDPELRQTAWWSVPLPADGVEDHLRTSKPDGWRSQSGGSSSFGDGPTVEQIDYTLPSPRPLAMSDVYLSVQWVQVGSATLVRADTFTAGRGVRSPESLVPDVVETIDLRLVLDGRRTRRVVTAADDPATVAALVAVVDGLPASVRPEQLVSCPAAIDTLPAATLTFHGVEHDLTFHVVDWCLGQVEVARNGVPISPTLDPSGMLDQIERLLR